MSAERFDELTKALAGGSSRRTVLKLLAASAAGGVLALFGTPAVQAKSCTSDAQCPSNAFCTNGRCTHLCKFGASICRGTGVFSGTVQCCSRGYTCCPLATTGQPHCCPV